MMVFASNLYLANWLLTWFPTDSGWMMISVKIVWLDDDCWAGSWTCRSGYVGDGGVYDDEACSLQPLSAKPSRTSGLALQVDSLN